MQKRKEFFKEKVFKRVITASMKAAEQSANSSCTWWLNQPQAPQSLKKMRKF